MYDEDDLPSYVVRYGTGEECRIPCEDLESDYDVIKERTKEYCETSEGSGPGPGSVEVNSSKKKANKKKKRGKK